MLLLTPTSNKVKVKVTKNKVAPPFREAIFDIEFGRGINHEGELIDIGTKREIITKRGAFYSLGDIRLGQGRDKACQYLKDNPDLAQSIEVSIRESFKEKPMQVAEMADFRYLCARNARIKGQRTRSYVD